MAEYLEGFEFMELTSWIEILMITKQVADHDRIYDEVKFSRAMNLTW